MKTEPTRRLIQMVKERKCLWDKNYPDYRDKFNKEKAWLEIHKEMEPAFDILQEAMKSQVAAQIIKKWYNIRDAYVKSVKHGGSLKRNRPYVYSEQLSFLDPIIFNDKSSGSNNTEEDRNSNDVEDNASEVWVNEEVFLDVNENSEAKRAKLDTTQHTDESVVSVLANLIQKEEDEDRAFFKSITPSVKSLSEDAKFEFRIQVMKLIKRLKVKDQSFNFKSEMHQESDSN